MASHEKLGKLLQGTVVVCVFTFMAGVGMQMDLEVGRLVLRRRWKAPAVGLAGQILVNPFSMWAILALFGRDLAVNTKLAAILLSCSPGGNGSNILTWVAHGTMVVSVIMTFASTAAAFASMPLFLFLGQAVFNSGAADDEKLAVPFVSVVLSLLVVTASFALGVCVQRRRGFAASQGAGRRLMQGGVVLAVFAGVVYAIDPVTRTYISHGSSAKYAVALLMNVAGLVVGYVLAVVARLPTIYRRTIAFEVGAQNLAIALAVGALAYDEGSLEASQFSGFVVVYALAQGLVNWTAALAWRWGTAKPDPIDDAALARAAAEAERAQQQQQQQQQSAGPGAAAGAAAATGGGDGAPAGGAEHVPASDGPAGNEPTNPPSSSSSKAAVAATGDDNYTPNDEAGGVELSLA